MLIEKISAVLKSISKKKKLPFLLSFMSFYLPTSIDIDIQKSSPRCGKEDVSIIFCVLSLPPHIIPYLFLFKVTI